MIQTRSIEDSELAKVEAFLLSVGCDPGVLAEQRQHTRAQPSYSQIVLVGPQIIGCMLMRHTRLRLWPALIECVEIRLYPAYSSVSLVVANRMRRNP